MPIALVLQMEGFRQGLKTLSEYRKPIYKHA